MNILVNFNGDNIIEQPYYYQVGTFAGLLAGLYWGNHTSGDLINHGDFGIGTPDLVDGELIIDQGRVMCADKDGLLHSLGTDIKVPFAIVTKFKPDHEITISKIASLSDLEKRLDQELKRLSYSQNDLFAIRGKGLFESIRVRSEARQEEPFQPLAMTLPKIQTYHHFQNIRGTLVITRFPEYLAAVNVAGYHIHFYDQDKKKGGHLYEISGKEEFNIEIMLLKEIRIANIDHSSNHNLVIPPYNSKEGKAVEKIQEFS